ncbi:MAG: 4-hydroxy-tetrahydrodipicolinate reductase [Promethearchaeota archaeon]
MDLTKIKGRVFSLGVDGSMGRIVAGMVLDDPELDLVGGTTVPGGPAVGTDVGTLLGRGPLGVEVRPADELERVLDRAKPDVVVDFTVAAATEQAAPVVTSRGIKYVVGTTGLSDRCLGTISENVKKTGSSAVVSSNMAPGVNVVFHVAGLLAKALEGWDVEIVEAHHHRKRDAPSGTALTIAARVCEALGVDLDEVAKYGRARGPAPRKVGSSEVGIHAVRAGDIVGDHTVIFAGPGERVELVHRAHGRQCFGAGTIRAIHFLLEKAEPGKVYDAAAALGLETSSGE